MKPLIAGLVIACAAPASFAQCNLYRHGIPDFDQVRTNLPNTGNMYCVPTSAVNLLGYIANRGVPGVLAGPRDWQSDANFNHVTDRIAFMGSLMSTHPTNGTSGGPSAFGLRIYLQATAPGKFTVSRYYGDYNVNSLLHHSVLNHLTNVCYGFYARDSVGRYSRTGGHCVTLAGLLDFCEPTFRIRYRDPASGGTLASTQSDFASAHSDASSEIFLDAANLPHSRIRLWDLGDNNTRRYLDGILTINPQVALTGSITTRDMIHIRRTVQLAGMLPPAENAVVPGNDELTQVALDFRQVDSFAVTFRDAPRRYTLWRTNLATGASEQLLVSESPMKIATNRFGDLFVSTDASIRKYAFPGEDMVLAQEAPVSGQVDAMAYDDTRDELAVLTTNDRLVRLRNDLSIPAIDFALPPAAVTPGSASIAIDEANQKYYISGRESAGIHVIGLIPGTPIPGVDATIFLPAVQFPEALQFSDDNTLVLMSNGVIAEFENGPAGWQPRVNSELAGMEAARALAIGRSRTNFVAGVHDTPEWNDVLVDEGLVETPDCDADFNLDAVLNSQDFFDFLTAFFAADPRADFNLNAAIDSQDLFDYLTAFFNGCN